MRNTSRLFCTTTIRSRNPLLYFVKENYIVLPVNSTNDFYESSMQKKAFILGTKEQQMHPVDVDPSWKMKETERKLMDELHRKEQFYPNHPALSSDLTYLAMYYLIQNKLNEARTTMQRAVELKMQLVSGTDSLPGWTNLAIIRYLNGDKDYSKHVFEFCVEGWYKYASDRTPDIKALPYFYNLLVMSNDTVLSKRAAVDFLNSIYPKLNSEHPFYKSCDALRETLQQSKTLVLTSHHSAKIK